MSTWLQATSMREEPKKNDYGERFAQVLPEAKAKAAAGQLNAAVEQLMALEKQCRLANDISTLRAVASAIMELIGEKQDWPMLKETLLVLAKRRGQRSGAIIAVVQKAMEFLPKLDEPTKVDMIVALRSVSDGKIFVEKERAQLTQMLSQIKEQRGDIEEAATIMQEVHVETYGAMTKLEKVEFILEQVRLTLAKKDYVRAYILSKKIKRSTLEESRDFDESKLKFYRLMIEYHTHEDDTLELARDWISILNTPTVLNEISQWQGALSHACVFVLLTKYSSEQQDVLRNLQLGSPEQIKRLAEMPVYESLLKAFTTDEIVDYPLRQDADIKGHQVFQTPEIGSKWYDVLKTRTIEHNLRVIEKHYDLISMPHLAKMLTLSEAELEFHISDLVSCGIIYARMNRPAKQVSFKKPENPEAILTNWSSDINELLKLVETNYHLINKENMIHKIAAKK